MNLPKIQILAAIFLVVLLAGCGPDPTPTLTPSYTATASPAPSATPAPTSTPTQLPPTPTRVRITTIQVRSEAFSSGKDFPEPYTCDGDDISPPLSWGDPPPGTKSFALIMDNPDAITEKGWVHWILFNIPADSRGLPEAVPDQPIHPDGSLPGTNSEEWTRYVGPCPPFTQRYYFRLYALDTLLNLEAGATREEVKEAMAGHILGKGELMGRYKRKTR